MDHDALNAALLAVQAESSVSRKALHRTLNARQRRPLHVDSEPNLNEDVLSMSRSSKGISTSALRAADRRRWTTLDDERVSGC